MLSVVECNCASDLCTPSLYMVNLNFVEDVHVMVPLNTFSLKKNAVCQLLLLYNLLTELFNFNGTDVYDSGDYLKMITNAFCFYC